MRLGLIIFCVCLAGCMPTIDAGTVFIPQKLPEGAGLFSKPETISSTAKISSGILKDPKGDIGYLIARDLNGPKNKPIIIHCGGNATQIFQEGSLYLSKLLPFGDVFLFDYPGYGLSDGAAEIQDFQRVAARIGREVPILMGRSNQPLVLWGHSLGGFVCAEIFGNIENPSAIVYETTAIDAESVGDAVIPWFAKPFVFPRIAPGLASFSTVQAVTTFNGPVLVLAAGKDRTLPTRLSTDLADELRAQGIETHYFVFPEADHFSVSDQPEFKNAVGRFFATLDRR